MVTASLAETYAVDGVAHLPGALGGDDLAAVEALFAHGQAHPGPGANRAYPDEGGTFWIDTFHLANWSHYDAAYAATAVPDLVAGLWGTPDVWFFYEQLFDKQGAMRRTPWHQDSTYLPVEGDHVAVVWIPLDPLDSWSSLEFVRGSHRGPMYNTSAFDPDDDTRPIADDPGLARLPDIEADRSAWDIVSWAIEPGDVVVFHPNVLHGGAPSRDGTRRRTVSLRYFGADATLARRSTLIPTLGDMDPGEPFRSPVFPHVRGEAATPAP